MNKIIEYKDLDDNCILIDVRSPGEYAESHIQNSINIPLFSNEERALVGTVYKQESIEKAKKIGVSIVSQKLSDIYEKLLQLKKEYKTIVIYCARGGMRSGTVCSLFSSLGLNIWQLKGGYKGYRAIVNSDLPSLNNQVTYIVLHGNTGVGKTQILKKLKERGMNILDLEGAANHRGSLLGSVGLGNTRSQKQFETIVYDNLLNRNSNFVFSESESKRIGSIIMPTYIADGLQTGKHILVEGSLDARAKLLIEEYGIKNGDNNELVESISKLSKYMSNETVDKLIAGIEEKRFVEVAKELMVNYYDPMYEHSQNKYNYDLIVDSDNIEQACDQIESWFKEKIDQSNS